MNDEQRSGDRTSPGRIVVLAGRSCAGKSTLGDAMLIELGAGWVFWNNDRVAALFPEAGLIAPERVQFMSDSEIAAARVAQRRVVEAEVGAIAAYARAGFCVIVERYLWDAEHSETAARLLDGIPRLVVELTVPVDVLETRERTRATTHIGFARTLVRSTVDPPRGCDDRCDTTGPRRGGRRAQCNSCVAGHPIPGSPSLRPSAPAEAGHEFRVARIRESWPARRLLHVCARRTPLVRWRLVGMVGRFGFPNRRTRFPWSWRGGRATGRMLFGWETDDVARECERIRRCGATVIEAPYHPADDPKGWLATLADPDGNYFQLLHPEVSIDRPQ